MEPYGWETNMMIGYHAVPVIVDAYLKGIGDFNAEKALEACIATANRDDYRGYRAIIRSWATYRLIAIRKMGELVFIEDLGVCLR